MGQVRTTTTGLLSPGDYKLAFEAFRKLPLEHGGDEDVVSLAN